METEDLPYFAVLHCEYCMERSAEQRATCTHCILLVEAYKERERKLAQIRLPDETLS